MEDNDLYVYWECYEDHDQYPDYDDWLIGLKLNELLNIYTTIELKRSGHEDI